MQRFIRANLVLLVIALASTARGQGEVHAYCSLDAEYSKEIFRDFEKATGIRVIDNMDTEDNKTVAMVNRLISEKDNPRCDVYWNNEVGHTVRLMRMGLLEPYVSPNAASIPAEFKDKDGHWTGLAARARVIIYNKNLIGDGAKPTGLADLSSAAWRGKATMAKPITGTTYSHVAALFAVWGEARTKKWLDDVRANDIYWNLGNATVMRDVGEGAHAWGYTDTDDANVASAERKYPTDIIVPDQGPDGLGTLIIPNSVMIMKGSKNLENAKKLVDWILSPDVEKKLALGRSAQIPLHPGIASPPHVLDLSKVKAMKVDWAEVGRMLDEHGKYLHETFDGGTASSGEKSSWFLVAIGVAAVIGLAILGTRHKAD